jgi:hypothetical protein
VPLPLLWLGIFAAPLVWAVQSVVNTALTSHACYPDGVPLARPMHGGLWTLLLVVSLATLLVQVVTGSLAWRNWRATRQEASGREHRALDTGEGRTRFMAMAGMLTSALFVLVSVGHTVTLFLVPPCGM